MTDKFTGFVLAGGKSSRMGKDKAFLKIGGETFLERAAKKIAPFGETKIVINPNQAEKFKSLFPSFEFIFDVHTERGALGGIHAGLRECRTQLAVFLAVDLPLITNEILEKLTSEAVESKEFSAVVPIQKDGRPQPLCAVYRTSECLPAAEQLLTKKTSASMRDFLELIKVKFVKLNDGADIFFNVNSPPDFAAIEENKS
jgi:Molybdopterin-guanine dinucleotide biosynthesis protein A